MNSNYFHDVIEFNVRGYDFDALRGGGVRFICEDFDDWINYNVYLFTQGLREGSGRLIFQLCFEVKSCVKHPSFLNI